ncbi:MAG: putative toxin-antitoxin system toxin component, PIN family [Nitriliruptorales bacterium]|nr:putative toxin-antitoxin system toxin component, PIN family [Nitriliruptorales bacterium]
MRAVLDPNVIISALLAPGGTPAKVLRAWLEGAYGLVGSPLLIAELERALAYPKLRKRIEEAEASDLVDLLRREAKMADDPADPPSVRSPDPGGDYLIALAAAAHAAIVSGDGHLLGLAEHLPVYSPAAFLALLEGDA